VKGIDDDKDARLAALRAALIEGEESGPPEPFDFEAFIRFKLPDRPPNLT
jgi:antitoxin ParD1/3/4